MKKLINEIVGYKQKHLTNKKTNNEADNKVNKKAYLE